MPRVLITDDEGTVLWDERVTPADFESEYVRCQLCERLTWAVTDTPLREHVIRSHGSAAGAGLERQAGDPQRVVGGALNAAASLPPPSGAARAVAVTHAAASAKPPAR